MPKISGLTLLSGASIDPASDLLAIVDASASATKRTTLTDVHDAIVAPDVATLNASITSINGSIASINGELATMATKTDLDNAQAAIEANDNANKTALSALINTISKTLHYFWPAPTGGNTSVANWSQQYNSSTVSEITASNVGTAPSTTAAYTDGVAAFKIQNAGAVASTSGQVLTHAVHPDFVIVKPTGAPSRPRAAWKFAHEFKCDVVTAAPASMVDVGITIAPAAIAGALFNSQGSVGIYFGLNHLGKVVFRARQVGAGALTMDQDVTPVGFDYTKFHTYELRVVDATATTDAYVQPYLDGVAVGTPASWGAGTVLPDFSAGGTPSIGWYVAHVAAAYVNSWAHYTSSMVIAAGPSVTALS